jgi:hypothetical protein
MNTSKTGLCALVALLSIGCGDLAELLSTSVCMGHQESPRLCALGEDVGQLPGGNSEHCCEKNKFFADTQCILIGSQRATVSLAVISKFAGYFSGELELDKDVKYAADVRIVRYNIANHKQTKDHCNQHDSACDGKDEFIRRKWDLFGTVTIDAMAAVEAAADLTRAARSEGMVANAKVDASKRQTLVTLGPFSMCEENDHEECGNLEDAKPASIPVVAPGGERTTVPFTPRTE